MVLCCHSWMDQLKDDGVEHAGAWPALCGGCSQGRLQSPQIDDDRSPRDSMEKLDARIDATSNEREGTRRGRPTRGIRWLRPADPGQSVLREGPRAPSHHVVAQSIDQKIVDIFFLARLDRAIAPLRPGSDSSCARWTGPRGLFETLRNSTNPILREPGAILRHPGRSHPAHSDRHHRREHP